MFIQEIFVYLHKQLYNMAKKKSTKPVIGTGSDEFEGSILMAAESISFGHENNYKTFRGDSATLSCRRKAKHSKPKSQLEESKGE